MKPFPVVRLLMLFRAFQKMVTAVGKTQSNEVAYSEDKRRINVVEGLKRLESECEAAYLPHTADQFRRIRNRISDKCTNTELSHMLDEAMNRIEDECQRNMLMVIDPGDAKYFSDAQFFDSDDTKVPKVSVQFPSANEDIAESGKCLACGRSTACVMHLNRVVEVGLQALAKALTVPQQNDSPKVPNVKFILLWIKTPI